MVIVRLSQCLRTDNENDERAFDRIMELYSSNVATVPFCFIPIDGWIFTGRYLRLLASLTRSKRRKVYQICPLASRFVWLCLPHTFECVLLAHKIVDIYANYLFQDVFFSYRQLIDSQQEEEAKLLIETYVEMVDDVFSLFEFMKYIVNTEQERLASEAKQKSQTFQIQEKIKLMKQVVDLRNWEEEMDQVKDDLRDMLFHSLEGMLLELSRTKKNDPRFLRALENATELRFEENIIQSWVKDFVSDFHVAKA